MNVYEDSSHKLSERFINLVGKDAKGKATSEESEWLRSDDMLVLWREALKHLLSDIDAQIAQNRAHAEQSRTEHIKVRERATSAEKAESRRRRLQHKRWLGDAKRFREYLQARLAEQKRLRGAADERRQAAAAHKKQDDRDQRQLLHTYRQLLRRTAFLIGDSEAGDRLEEPYASKATELKHEIEQTVYRSGKKDGKTFAGKEEREGS